MKMVYIVTTGAYEDYTILGVFSTKKKAKEFIKSVDEGQIEEWEIDLTEV